MNRNPTMVVIVEQLRNIHKVPSRDYVDTGKGVSNSDYVHRYTLGVQASSDISTEQQSE